MVQSRLTKANNRSPMVPASRGLQRRCDRMPPMRLRWLTIVLMGVGLLTACADPEATLMPSPTPILTPEPGAAERPGNQGVYDRIDSLESCPALQHELDAANNNAERVKRVEAGDRLLDIALAYAKYADERLREIGCYD